jgi:hypothetical protein
VLVAVTIVLGVVRVAMERSSSLWNALGMWMIGGVLFVVVSSVGYWPLRDALTGSWYNNWPRLAALFAVALVPLATAGLIGVAERASTVLPGIVVGRSGTAIAVLAAVALSWVAQFPAMPPAQTAAHKQYVMDNDAKLLSTDELTLLEGLGDQVPEDAVIAGNPYTGAGLAYAFADRRVLMPHMLMYLTAEGHAVNDGLDAAGVAPSVCSAIRKLGVTHVLDFGEREVHGGRHDYAGLDDLASSDAVELVDEVGQARLYRVTACGLR